jgi:signal transduction histidine kinase
VALGRVADAAWSDPPAHPALRFAAYLAATIRVGEQPAGTLVFASPEPRGERFTASHKELLLLMAQWIGSELERAELLRARDETEPRPGPTSPPVRSVPSRRREIAADSALHLDAALSKLERRIRRAAGERVQVVVEREPGLAPIRGARLPLDAIVLSLVQRAVESMPEGGTLTLRAASHPGAGGEPTAPPRFVTLSVRESGGALGADALARVFDREPDDAVVRAETALSPASIRRMLQRAGGDLSVEVEPGRGSTTTIFLPAADEVPEAPRAPGPAPVAPAAGH